MARHVNVALVLINVLVFQIVCLSPLLKAVFPSASSMDPYNLPSSTGNSGSPISDNVLQQHLRNPLALPPGSPPNLPSIRTKAKDDGNVDEARKIYGGAGDKKHLGGFTELDLHGISPTLWTQMIQTYGVRSFLDIGCGRGTSSRWFLEHGADILCVEGSHDAILKSFLPPDKVVEHDFSRGPWWPEKTYDAAWSVEFLEHVSRQYHYNYISTLRKAALIFVTSSRWGGWHHVEIHPDEWWIRKYESYGFKYDTELTTQSRKWAKSDAYNKTVLAPNGKPFEPQHIYTSLKVFVNPAVAALPQHQHLFPDHGCFYNYSTGAFRTVRRPCGGPGSSEAHLETKLPDSYEPLSVTPEMHQKWNDFIKSRLEVKKGP